MVAPNPASNDEYHLRLTEAGRSYNCFQLAPEQIRFGDCQIDVDTRRIVGPEQMFYGLTFRIQPGIPGADNYERLTFIVTGDGAWGSSYIPAHGSGSLVVPKTPTALYDKGNGLNHLTVVCSGAQLKFKLNRQTIGSANTSLISEGMIGLYIGMQPGSPPGEIAEVAFSNLQVSSVAQGGQ
jgi:hypothetical protein